MGILVLCNGGSNRPDLMIIDLASAPARYSLISPTDSFGHAEAEVGSKNMGIIL